MRAGNARSFVTPGRRGKPGQSATPCGAGASRRPVLPPDPRWLGTNSAISRAARRYGLREQSGHGAAWRHQVRSSHARVAALRPAPDLPSWSDAHVAGDVTHPARRACVGRARQARPIAVIVPAVGLARGEERRSGDGPAGPAPLIEQNQPTASRPDVDCAARPDCGSRSTPSRACGSSPTRPCRVPLGSRQLAI